MMFDLVSLDGSKMDPVFLPSGLRMGAKDFVDFVLKSNVVPWVKATPYGQRSNQLPVQEPTTTLRPPSRLTSLMPG